MKLYAVVETSRDDGTEFIVGHPNDPLHALAVFETCPEARAERDRLRMRGDDVKVIRFNQHKEDK